MLRFWVASRKNVSTVPLFVFLSPHFPPSSVFIFWSVASFSPSTHLWICPSVHSTATSDHCVCVSVSVCGCVSVSLYVWAIYNTLYSKWQMRCENSLRVGSQPVKFAPLVMPVSFPSLAFGDNAVWIVIDQQFLDNPVEFFHMRCYSQTCCKSLFIYMHCYYNSSPRWGHSLTSSSWKKKNNRLITCVYMFI